MPQQFVQLGQTNPDYSQLLSMTDPAASRQHAEQRRKAAQAALLQQMVNRGEIKLAKGDEVKVGDDKMEFGSPQAKGNFEKSFAPVAKNLSKESENSSTQTLDASMGDLAAQATYNAMQAHLAANPGQQERMAAATALHDKILRDYGDNEAGELAKRILNGQDTPSTIQPSEVKTATDAATVMSADAAAKVEPPAKNEESLVAPPATTPTTTAPTTQTPTTSVNETAGVKKAARLRSELSAEATPMTVDVKGGDRYKTTNVKGMNFYDEIQETLPSLRRNAQLEAIAAMFGGGTQKGPGQYDALANQRERDLAEYNKRLETTGTATTISGGLTDIKVDGGNTKVSGKDVAATDNSIKITVGDRTNNPGGGEHINKLQVQDANGQDTTLNFNDNGQLTQMADNLAVYISGTTKIGRGSDLTAYAKSKHNSNGPYAAWKITDDSQPGKDPSIIQIQRPDGKAIRFVHDPGVVHSKNGVGKGLVGWKLQADAGMDQAAIQYWGGITANSKETGTQNRASPKREATNDE